MAIKYDNENMVIKFEYFNNEQDMAPRYMLEYYKSNDGPTIAIQSVDGTSPLVAYPAKLFSEVSSFLQTQMGNAIEQKIPIVLSPPRAKRKSTIPAPVVISKDRSGVTVENQQEFDNIDGHPFESFAATAPDVPKAQSIQQEEDIKEGVSQVKLTEDDRKAILDERQSARANASKNEQPRIQRKESRKTGE